LLATSENLAEDISTLFKDRRISFYSPTCCSSRHRLRPRLLHLRSQVQLHQSLHLRQLLRPDWIIFYAGGNLMHVLCDTRTEGVIAAWHKKVGDQVKKGDILADIETDKATMELEVIKKALLLPELKKVKRLQ